MKHTLLISLICTLLTSCCINEDGSDCKNEYPLIFSYNGDGNTDIFQSKIENVDLYVFGQDNNLVLKQHIDKVDLATFQGTRLDLFPGKYRVVLWGNITPMTTIRNEHDLAEAELATMNYYNSSTIINNDSLYYSSREIYVPNTSMAPDTMKIVGAHIKLIINIHGSTQVNVRVNNLAPTYNFAMHSLKPLTDHRPTGTNSFNFNILRILDDNIVMVELYDSSTNELIYTLSLKDYMIQNNISVSNRNEVTIVIEFYISELGIIVLPWEDDDLHPEI